MQNQFANPNSKLTSWLFSTILFFLVNLWFDCVVLWMRPERVEVSDVNLKVRPTFFDLFLYVRKSEIEKPPYCFRPSSNTQGLRNVQFYEKCFSKYFFVRKNWIKINCTVYTVLELSDCRWEDVTKQILLWGILHRIQFSNNRDTLEFWMFLPSSITFQICSYLSPLKNPVKIYKLVSIPRSI